jgi:hypothetical protein
MAKYVSNTAGRLGRHYSRGVSFSEIMPHSATEAFETVTGVYDVKKEARMSRIMKKKEHQAALSELEDEDMEVIFASESETTAHIFIEGVYTSAALLKRRPALGRKRLELTAGKVAVLHCRARKY